MLSTGYVVFKKGSFSYLPVVKRIILWSEKLMNITVNVLSYKIPKQNLHVCICMLHIYGLFLIIYMFF